MSSNQLLIKIITFVLVSNLIFSCNNKDPLPLANYDENNFVPNKQTAKKIAVAVWVPIYGNSIYFKRPYKTRLVNDEIWIVEGSLPFFAIGGVPYIEIRKSDGKIISVSHSK
jgi:hypothetical protein